MLRRWNKWCGNIFLNSSIPDKIIFAALSFGHPGLTLRCTFRIVINNVTTFQNHLFVGEHQHSPCNIFCNNYLLINSYKVQRSN